MPTIAVPRRLAAAALWCLSLHLQAHFVAVAAEWTPAEQAAPEDAEDHGTPNSFLHPAAQRRALSSSVDALEQKWVPAGLWMPAEATTDAKSRILRCFDLDVCPGGQPGACAKGRSGVACADCEGAGDSSKRSSSQTRPAPYSGACETCDVCYTVWFFVFEVSLVFLALAWSTLYTLGSSFNIEKKMTIEDQPDAVAHTSRGQIAAILHVGLPAMQLVALSVAEARALAPKSVGIFGGFLQGFLDLFTFNARPLRPACIVLSFGGEAAPSDLLIISTAIPLLWFLGVAALLLLGKIGRSCECLQESSKADNESADANGGLWSKVLCCCCCPRIWRTCLRWLWKSPIVREPVGVEEIMAAMVVFIYSFSVALVRLSLRFVDCVHHPGGLRTSSLHPGMECATAGYGVPLQVGLGILLLLGGYLMLLKGRISDKKLERGSLFWLQIQAEFWWWPLVPTARNAAAALAASHVGHSPLGGHMGLIVVQALYCVATACCSPWCTTALNRLDMFTSAIGSVFATALAAAALGSAPMTEAIASQGDVQAASYIAVILFAMLLLVLIFSTCAVRWILPDLSTMRERDRGYRLRVVQWIMQQSLYLCSAEPRIYRMIINSLSRREVEEVANSISIVYDQLRQDPEAGLRVNQERWAALQSISEEWIIKLADPEDEKAKALPISESRRNSQDLSNTGWGPLSVAPSMAPSRSVSQAPSANTSRRSSVSLVSMRDLLGYQGSRRSSFAGTGSLNGPDQQFKPDSGRNSDRPGANRNSTGTNSSRRQSLARLSRRSSKFALSASRRQSGVGIASETGDLLSLRKQDGSPGDEKEDDRMSVMDVSVTDVQERCGRNSIERETGMSSIHEARKSVTFLEAPVVDMDKVESAFNQQTSESSEPELERVGRHRSDGSAEDDAESPPETPPGLGRSGSADFRIQKSGSAEFPGGTGVNSVESSDLLGLGSYGSGGSCKSPDGSWSMTGTFKSALGKIFGTKSVAKEEQEWKERTWSPCASAEISVTSQAYRKHFKDILNSSGTTMIISPEKSPAGSPTSANKDQSKPLLQWQSGDSDASTSAAPQQSEHPRQEGDDCGASAPSTSERSAQPPESEALMPEPPEKCEPEPPDVEDAPVAQVVWTVTAPSEMQGQENKTVETTVVQDITALALGGSKSPGDVDESASNTEAAEGDDQKARWKARKAKRKAGRPAGFFFSQDSYCSSMGMDDEAGADAAASLLSRPICSAPVSVRNSLRGNDADDRPHWYKATEIFNAQRATEREALQRVEARARELAAQDQASKDQAVLAAKDEAKKADEPEVVVSDAESAQSEAKQKWEARRAAKKAAKEAGTGGEDYRAYLLAQTPQAKIEAAEAEATSTETGQRGEPAAIAVEPLLPPVTAQPVPENDEDAALRRLEEKFQQAISGKSEVTSEAIDESPEAKSKYEARKAKRSARKEAAENALKTGDHSAVSKGYGAWIMATYTSNVDNDTQALPGPVRPKSTPGVGVHDENTATSQLFGGITGTLAQRRGQEGDRKNEFGGDVRKQQAHNDPKEWKSWMRSSSAALHNRYKKRDEKRQQSDGSSMSGSECRSMSASSAEDDSEFENLKRTSSMVVKSTQRKSSETTLIRTNSLRTTKRPQTMPNIIDEFSHEDSATSVAAAPPGGTPPPVKKRNSTPPPEKADASLSPSSDEPDESPKSKRNSIAEALLDTTRRKSNCAVTDDSIAGPAEDDSPVKKANLALLRRSLTTSLEHLQEESTAAPDPTYETEATQHSDGITGSTDLPSGAPLEDAADASIELPREKLQQMALLRRSLSVSIEKSRHNPAGDAQSHSHLAPFYQDMNHSGLSTVHESGANSIIGSQRPSALVTSGIGSSSGSATSRGSLNGDEPSGKGSFLGRLGGRVGSMLSKWRGKEPPSGLAMIPDSTLQQLACVNPEIQRSPLYRGEIAKRLGGTQAVMEEDENGTGSDSLCNSGSSQKELEEPQSPTADTTGEGLKRSLSMKSTVSTKSKKSVAPLDRTWSIADKMNVRNMAEAASAIAQVVSGKRKSKGDSAQSSGHNTRRGSTETDTVEDPGPPVTSIFSDPPPMSRTGSFAVGMTVTARGLFRSQNSDSFAEFGRQLERSNATSSNRPAPVAPGDWLVAPNSVLRLVTSQAYGGVLGNAPSMPTGGIGSLQDPHWPEPLPENPHTVSLHPDLVGEKRFSVGMVADDANSISKHSGSDTSEARSEATAVLLSKARAGMDSEEDHRGSASSTTLNINRVLSGDSLGGPFSSQGSIRGSKVSNLEEPRDNTSFKLPKGASGSLEEGTYTSENREKVMTTPDPQQFKSDHSDSNSSAGNSSITSSVASRGRLGFSPLTDRSLALRASDCSMRKKFGKDNNSSDSGTDSETAPRRREWRTKTT